MKGRSRRCSCPTSTTEVANVTADLDTRAGELYASGAELPAGQLGSDDAAGGGSGSVRSRGDWAIPAGFWSSREQFESLVSFLDGTDAAGLSHAELEERLDRDGRELLRRLLEDHLRYGRCESSVLRVSSAMRGLPVAGLRAVMSARLRPCLARCRSSGWPTGRPGWGTSIPPTQRSTCPWSAIRTGSASSPRWRVPAAASMTRSRRSSGRPGSGWGNARSKSSPDWPRWTLRTSMGSGVRPDPSPGICWSSRPTARGS